MVGQQLVTINRHLHVNAHMYSKCNTSSLTYYIIDVCRRPLRPKPSKHYKQHRPRRGKAAAAPIISMRAVVSTSGCAPADAAARTPAASAHARRRRPTCRGDCAYIRLQHIVQQHKEFTLLTPMREVGHNVCPAPHLTERHNIK
jgi:transposase